MTSETDRAVYLQRIDPAHRDAYLNAHENVPEGVSKAMRDGTVKSFDLYIRDNIAVCILEAEDLDRYFDSIEGNKTVDEWERYVGAFKQSGVDVDNADEPIPLMEHVWSLNAE